MSLIIVQCLYLMLPAYFANMAPVIIKDSFKRLAIPLDMNKKLNNNPIFGKNKTVRGFLSGIIFALVVAYIQHFLYNYELFRGWSLINYHDWFRLGFLMGMGAMLGDLGESFIKRRLNLKPGERFIPWDQIDFVIGAILLIYPIVKLTWPKILIIIIGSFILHIIVNHLAFYLKIRDEKW